MVGELHSVWPWIVTDQSLALGGGEEGGALPVRLELVPVAQLEVRIRRATLQVVRDAVACDEGMREARCRVELDDLRSLTSSDVETARPLQLSSASL